MVNPYRTLGTEKHCNLKSTIRFIISIASNLDCKSWFHLLRTLYSPRSIPTFPQAANSTQPKSTMFHPNLLTWASSTFFLFILEFFSYPSFSLSVSPSLKSFFPNPSPSLPTYALTLLVGFYVYNMLKFFCMSTLTLPCPMCSSSLSYDNVNIPCFFLETVFSICSCKLILKHLAPPQRWGFLVFL